MTWKQMGAIAPDALGDARLQLHYGALVLGSVAHALLEHADDDSHTNLGFDAATQSLVTRPLPAGTSLALDLPALALEFRGDTTARFELPGKTLADACAWAGERFSCAVSQREYADLPASPVRDGGAFDRVDEAACAELGNWFANGFAVLQEVVTREPGMSQVRVWPHHFDVGALIALAGGADQVIGLGLSPGDENYDRPYFYCSPYPQPSADVERPELDVGSWHTEGFIAAVLTGDELVASPSQLDAARGFLRDAVMGCRQLVS